MSELNFEKIAAYAIAAIVAITFHEASHGFVAWRLGDSTAYNQGRVTFNPLKHIDPLGTIVLPVLIYVSTQGAALFGWAKPVPVDPRQLYNPRRDMVIVAAAGPGINFALAFLAALVWSFYGLPARDIGPNFVHHLLFQTIQWNILLAIFNLIPLPPLDGGRIAVGVLPGSLAFPLARLEPYGFWILIAVIFIVPTVTNLLGNEINPFAAVLSPIFQAVYRFIMSAVGPASLT